MHHLFTAALALPAPVVLLLGEGAEEKAPPVLDLDGTAIIQFAVFVVMYFFLKHVFFAPYLEMKRLRTAGIDGARAEAAQMEQRAQELGADYDRHLQVARAQAEDERLRLRTQGQEREREVLAQTKGVTQGQIQAARVQIGQETSAAQAQLAQQAMPLARQVARKILGREV